MQQLVNYMLTKVAKQGNALGLFLTANNAMLVKLEKKKGKQTGDCDFERTWWNIQKSERE